MRFGKNTLAAVAAIALAAIPVTAQAADSKAKPVASKVKRAGSASNEESKIGAGVGLLLPLAAAAAIILGVVVLSDDSPSSP